MLFCCCFSLSEAEAAIVREVRDYARRLQQQHPQKYSTIIVALSWPQNKLPETPLEARNFVDAAMSEFSEKLCLVRLVGFAYDGKPKTLGCSKHRYLLIQV